MISRLLAVLALLLFTAVTALPQPAVLSGVGNACCVISGANGDDFVVDAESNVYNIDARGNVVSVFSSQLGNASGAAVDPEGHLWIVGSTPYAAAPPYAQGFIAELDSQGKSVLYTRTLGSSDPQGWSYATALAIDPYGSVYVGGATNQWTFPTTPGAFMTAPGSPPQGTGGSAYQGPIVYGFILKLTPQLLPGSGRFRLTYSTLLGGTQTAALSNSLYSSITALAVDASEVVTVTGVTSASDFPLTPGAFQTKGPNGFAQYTVFVARLNVRGSALVWSTLLDGSLANEAAQTPSIAKGVALDSSGNVIVDGITSASDFPVTNGVVQPRLGSPWPSGSVPVSAFIAKLNSSGNGLIFSTYYGGGAVSTLSAPRLDAQDNIWITSVVVPQDGLVLQPDSLMLGDELLAEFTPDGSEILFSELVPAGVIGQDLALNPDGSLTAAGSGFVLRQPRTIPSGVSILGIADSAGAAALADFAPGEYISIYGTGLGPAAGVVGKADVTGRIPTSLGGTQVWFDGIPAPILYASANQLNVLAPYGIAGRSQANLQIISDTGVSQTFPGYVVTADPNIFVVLGPNGAASSVGNPAVSGMPVSIYVSGAGLLSQEWPDGTIALAPAPRPVLPVTVSFGEQTVSPFSFLPVDVTYPATPTYVGSVPGLPVNMLRIDVTVPMREGLQFVTVQIGEWHATLNLSVPVTRRKISRP